MSARKRKLTMFRNLKAIFVVFIVLSLFTILLTTIHINWGEDYVIAGVFGWNWETIMLLAIGLFLSPIITIYIMKKTRIVKSG